MNPLKLSIRGKKNNNPLKFQMKDAKNNEHSYKTTASGQLEKD